MHSFSNAALFLMTGAVNSHEILVMPTTAMDERSKDYAIGFFLILSG
jgi:aromatic ring hydroxylase